MTNNFRDITLYILEKKNNWMMYKKYACAALQCHLVMIRIHKI